MAGHFTFPDSSPPSTPDRSSHRGIKTWDVAEPSTTPAGPPPPSSTASFTPAGAPSASYLGSSILRGAHCTVRSSIAPNMAGPDTSINPLPSRPVKTSSKPGNTPLGRSVRSCFDTNGRGSSGLSKQCRVSDENVQERLPPHTKGTYGMDYSDDEATEHETTMHEEDDADGEDDAHGDECTQKDGYFVENDHHEDYIPEMNVPYLEDDDDMDLMVAAAHANERVAQEAEDLYRASTKFPSLSMSRDMVYARDAKEIHEQSGIADLQENDDVILKTEDLTSRLYDEGVGTTDDRNRLDTALANVSVQLSNVWQDFATTITHDIEEATPTIGPGSKADKFRKAQWLASLVLQMHHTRFTKDSNLVAPPLPEILMDWLKREHDVLSTAQIAEIARYRPSPACHQLFWSSVVNSVSRGMVDVAIKLLSEAGWEHVRTQGSRGDLAYTGQSLHHLKHAVQLTVDMLELCPGFKENWDTLGDEWRLFRSKSKTIRDQLARFAEGRDRTRGLETSSRFQERQISIRNMCREAESKVPWDAYQQLQSIFDVVLGKEAAILEACQDWCEASVALLAWLDEGSAARPLNPSRSQNLSRSMQVAPPMSTLEPYSERLTRCFHVAVDEFSLNPVDLDELTYACAFEGNFEGVVRGLRMWSMPIASAVAEIASLGGWLPRPEPNSLIVMDSLGNEDLELLGMESLGPDETDGHKDTTLVEYAKGLAGRGTMRAIIDGRETVRHGWEVAVEVLGRLDSRAKSESMVGQVLENVLENISLDSSPIIEKSWKLLNDLGMLNFAEETVESYADLLVRESHRYGEALWYYALAHRNNKVREVLNLLMSYSLVQSTAFPSASDLDDYLSRLLYQRNATLEQLAQTDLEAAELLGKMLAGYATLRKFYDLRDGVAPVELPPEQQRSTSPLLRTATTSTTKGPTKRQQAAAALMAVIASSDDNIRGGLYDSTRDAVVSEDFMLALLGEAMVFLRPPPSISSPLSRETTLNQGDDCYNINDDGDETDLTLHQLETLFKAVEDIQTVGPRVFSVAEQFFDTALAGTPATNVTGLRKSTTTTVAVPRDENNNSAASSFVLTGSSFFASQIVSSAAAGNNVQGNEKVGNSYCEVRKRGWDWRRGLKPGTRARDVLRIIRLGLGREVARVWVRSADSVGL